MSAITTRFDGIDCHISRSGYTGEDGYEISCKATRVRAIVERLLSEPSVKLIGLGARDSLRLEAGLLPLWARYRHDDVAGRGGADLVDRQAAARGGRLSRRRAHPARTARRRRAAARRHQAGRPRAGARGHRDQVGGGRADRQGHVRRLRAERQRADLDGLCREGIRRAGHEGAADRARQADAGGDRRAAVRAASLCSLRGRNDGHTLHQGPRMDPPRRRCRHRRHHRARAVAARRHRLRRAA